MGAKSSLMYSPLANSIIGKKFRTKQSVSLNYCGYGKIYYITKWGEPSPGNPGDESFSLEVLDPIEFIITDVIINWDLFNGPLITIKAKILNNIPINIIGIVYEAFSEIKTFHNGDNFTDRYWKIKSFDTLSTKHIPGIKFDNISNTEPRSTIVLNTSNLDIILYYFTLGLNIPKNNTGIDYKGIITNDGSILEEIF